MTLPTLMLPSPHRCQALSAGDVTDLYYKPRLVVIVAILKLPQGSCLSTFLCEFMACFMDSLIQS